MKFKKQYCIIFFLSLVACVNAQKRDYLVIKEKDTVFYERVQYNSHHGIKVTKNGETKKIYNSKEFVSGFDSKKNIHFETVKNPFSWYSYKPDLILYLRRIVDGKIKIFVEYHSQTGNDYFISKDGSELERIYRGFGLKLKEDVSIRLKEYISDNETAVKEMDILISKKPTHEMILEFINNYNNSY